MSSLTVVVHPRFDASWPFAVADLVDGWPGSPPHVVRLPIGSTASLGAVARSTPAVARATALMSLGSTVTPDCLQELGLLTHVWFDAKGTAPAALAEPLAQRGIVTVRHRDKAYYAKSVREMVLGLTISALRRIPLMDRRTRQGDPGIWTYGPPVEGQPPGLRGEQFADDPRFVNGTLSGKQVRILGAGNIGARYAAVARFLGADVTVLDPGASDLTVALSGVKVARSIEQLVEGADVFAPMLPRTTETEGLVTAKHVDSLPHGALVVLAARARVCEMTALRRRVTAGELSLAADVFDVEPLPPDDPLLQLDHVVLTPHLAGKTRDTNRAWARLAVAQWLAAPGAIG